MSIVAYSNSKEHGMVCSYCSTTIEPNMKVHAIEHLEKIYHVFHSLCFAVVMCENFDFLKNCKLKNCPVCKEKLEIDFNPVKQKELASSAFCYHVQHGNADAVGKIVSSGLIPEEIKNKIFQQRPEFASDFAKHSFAKAQPIDDFDLAFPEKKLTNPSCFPSDQTVYKYQPESRHPQQLIKMMRREHPSISLRELQKYVKFVSGENYSLSFISKAIND